MLESLPAVAFMVLKVAVVVTFIKVLLAKINVVIEGMWAVVVAVLSSIGVWGYYVFTTGTPIDIGAIGILIEVIIGSTIGYKLLPESVKEFDLVNLRGEILNRESK